MNEFKVYIIYYYYYCKLLHDLIYKKNYSYEWLNINDYIFLNCSYKSFKNYPKGNLFLKDSIYDYSQLGQDIIDNGMYFPFFLFEETQEEKTNKIKRLILGKHRLYSLLFNKEQLKNKKFLFIKIPYKDRSSIKNNINNIEKIQVYSLLNENIYIGEKNNDLEIYNKLIYFGDLLPNYIYPYKNKIFPNPIFNDEKLFEEFINNPFNENNLKIIKQNWKNLEGE